MGLSTHSLLYRLWRNERGASAVEYGLIASLFILALIPTLQELSGVNSERRSAMHCAKRIMEVSAKGKEERLKRIIGKRGACRRFVK
ncbi:MAG: Flp family type IVb pilin [Pseudomonadota bacterium]